MTMDILDNIPLFESAANFQEISRLALSDHSVKNMTFSQRCLLVIDARHQIAMQRCLIRSIYSNASYSQDARMDTINHCREKIETIKAYASDLLNEQEKKQFQVLFADIATDLYNTGSGGSSNG